MSSIKSAADCELCRLTEQCVSETLHSFQLAHEQGFAIGPSGYRFFLSLRLDSDGVQVLGRRDDGDADYGFCVNDGTVETETSVHDCDVQSFSARATGAVVLDDTVLCCKLRTKYKRILKLGCSGSKITCSDNALSIFGSQWLRGSALHGDRPMTNAMITR